jgi:hypothetical protein
MCLECPPVPNPWTGEIDPIALADLCEAMGLKEDVLIAVDDDAICDRDTDGCYDLKGSFDAGKHVIYMCSNLTPEHANEVVVHELAHAQQAEMLGFSYEGLLRMQRLYNDDLGHEMLEFHADAQERKFAARYTVALSESMAVAA